MHGSHRREQPCRDLHTQYRRGGYAAHKRAGRDTTYALDANYNITQVTDPLAHTTRSTYDTRGNVLTHTNALSQTTTYTYNSTNDLLTATDPLGHTTTNGYDAAGNRTSVTDALFQDHARDLRQPRPTPHHDGCEQSRRPPTVITPPGT